MAKFNLKKQSKRQPARQRYKIQKKIRQHNKKLRREAKKNPKKTKKETIQVPNICPFKEDILKEVEAMKKQKEEEKQKQRELSRIERDKKKEEAKKTSKEGGLEALVANAEFRGKLHDNLTPDSSEQKDIGPSHENSLKAYYKEFRKVIEAADVILEIVDARDPIGTRCVEVEQSVHDSSGSKKLVLVLNKADLVPRDVLDKWLKYLRTKTPCIAFKASTQNQTNRLGQRKFSKAHKAMHGSASVGAELLMSLLNNYCRNKGIKTSIKVGVVGLPNVGKSSIINSLKRSKSCNVGATPGVTRAMQEIQLDSKIKLLDSPGIVFASGSDSSSCLRNAVRVSSLADPITPANAILQRVGKDHMRELYDITDYSTPEEFYTLKAARTGRYKKGGIPDTIAAARGLIEDWNSGKIKYYTLPPEIDEKDVYISSCIVTEEAKEFNIEEFASMETDILGQISKETDFQKKPCLLESLGPVNCSEEMDQDDSEPNKDTTDTLLSEKIKIYQTAEKGNKKSKGDARVKEVDPEMKLEGNQKLNKTRKLQFKKEKKQRNRREKVAEQLSAGLENFNITTKVKESDDSYNFDEDYQMKSNE